MIYVVASIEALTCFVLGVIFWRVGEHRLAIAQACYGVATVALFAR